MRMTFLLILWVGLAGCSTLKFAPGEVSTSAKYVVPTPAAADDPLLLTVFDAKLLIPFVGLSKLNRQAQMRDQLAQSLKAEGLDMPMQLQMELERQLAAQGFETGPYRTYRGGLRGNAYPRANDLPRGAARQQFIDTSIVHGFVAPVSGTDFRATVAVQLQVLAADTHAVLYQKKFFANFPTIGVDAIGIDVPDAIPTWANVEAIQRDIPGANAALKELVGLVVKEIVKELQAVQPVGTK